MRSKPIQSRRWLHPPVLGTDGRNGSDQPRLLRPGARVRGSLLSHSEAAKDILSTLLMDIPSRSTNPKKSCSLRRHTTQKLASPGFDVRQALHENHPKPDHTHSTLSDWRIWAKTGGTVQFMRENTRATSIAGSGSWDVEALAGISLPDRSNAWGSLSPRYSTAYVMQEQEEFQHHAFDISAGRGEKDECIFAPTVRTGVLSRTPTAFSS